MGPPPFPSAVSTAGLSVPGGRSRTVGSLFTVLVCPLDGVNGADGGLAANAILQALRRREGLRVAVVRGSPTAGPGRRGGGLVSLLDHTTTTARGWMAQHGADALIWGQRAGDTIRLSVTGTGPRLDGSQPLGLHPWSTLQLPLPLSREGADLLHALVLSALTPADGVARAAHDRALGRALARAETILDQGAAPPGAIRDGYRVALGLLHRVQGLRLHDPLRLARAVRLLEAGLAALSREWPRDLVTLARIDWAETVLELMRLTEVGRPDPAVAPARTLAEARLDDVVAACRAAALRLAPPSASAADPSDGATAADDGPPSALPEAYAVVQGALARAWRRCGVRDRDPGAVDAAVAALRAAGTVWTPTRDPVRWRLLTASIGSALCERAALQRTEPAAAAAACTEAVAAYRAVLETLSPEDDAVAWAHARNNLGVALLELDRAGADPRADPRAMAGDGPDDRWRPAVRAEAARCFGDALGVYEGLGMAGAARAARRNLIRLRAAVRSRLGRPSPSTSVPAPAPPALPAPSADDAADAEQRGPNVVPFPRRRA